MSPLSLPWPRLDLFRTALVWELGAVSFFIEADQADVVSEFICPETQNNTTTPRKSDYYFPALSLPLLASSPNMTTFSPGLNVEIVGGSSVLIVMDGSWEDYSKDLQLRQPVLKGRSQSKQIICLFLSLQLADDTPTLLPFLPAAGKLQPNARFLTNRTRPFSSVRRPGDVWFENGMPGKVAKAKQQLHFLQGSKKDEHVDFKSPCCNLSQISNKVPRWAQ